MVIIKEVTTRRALRTFVTFPQKLYRDCPQFVPSMYGDDMANWNRKKNPAFSYCEAKCFLAYRGRKVVGRIAAILSHKANEKWGRCRMRFSQVDFIDDPEVSEALFGAVEDYAHAMGCEAVHGPLGFSDLDPEGMLVEGFDQRNMFITYYNHPYYLEHMERLGYQKSVDWMEYKVFTPEKGSRQAAMLERVSNHVLKANHLHRAVVRSKRDFKPLVRKVFELVNIAYSHLYGVVELTDQQIKRYAAKFIPLINPKYTCFILDEQENLVAFGVTAPSMAEALKRSHGRLFPLGWIGVLRALHKNDALDMFLIAVHPDMQSVGINAAIIEHVMKNAWENGIRYAETGPQLETNAKILTQWNIFDKEQHKRRRCYIKEL
ncbi:MAG: GNAT family N-acetyltransferase [Clostridia bacterium]|nr:GNAT family N-acetyltransferase [Clostridia bacterium]